MRMCSFFGFFNHLGLALSVLTAPAAFGQGVEGGRFGRALRSGESYAAAAPNPVYSLVPMTVECWAKLSDKGVDQILIANEPRNSVTHWELYAAKGSGVLSVMFPGYLPRSVASTRDIVDGKWHYLAMIFDGKSVQLWVDAKQAANARIMKVAPYPDTGPLNFGHMDGTPHSGFVLIDEVRISRVIRKVDRVPELPFVSDVDTLGLWHFDEDSVAYDKTAFADASTTRNPARLKLITRDEPQTAAAHTRWQDMEYGPFFSSTLGCPMPRGNITYKGISIHLGADEQASVCFDTELLRYSAGWTGKFLKIYPNREGLAEHPNVAGTPVFATLPGPGWWRDSEFNDPRPDRLGPLPAKWGKYKGLYLHGRRAILSYTVGETAVLECPDAQAAKTSTIFSRTLNIAPSEKAIGALICDVPGAKAQVRGAVAMLEKPDGVTAAAVIGDPAATLRVERSHIVLAVAPHTSFAAVRVLIWSGQPDELAGFESLAAQSKASQVENLEPLTHGGPPRYPAAVETRGELGTTKGPYVVDTLTAPDDNPWKSFLRFGGLDFFSNGNAAICSISGDVWVVSGIDEKLDHLKWRRYATGLFQPLGLKIVDDKVYVLGRDQITLLHDLNGDGEADFYENFNNQCKVTENGHAYTTNLETDPEGNFYYVKCGDGTAHGGTVLRVDKYGQNLQVFATGVRNSNGLGISPSGQVIEADNQGEWVPASRIDLVKQGSFLGFEPMAHATPSPTDPGKPICWMPQNCDNSSSSQAWVSSDKWGPFKGEMLHTSYGQAAIYHVMTETIDGVTQGGVYKFPLDFSTGIMRGRFRAADGQFYVCGLKGWQTRGVKDGALQRVRYTGEAVHMPSALHVHKNGILLSFTCPLDPKTAGDPDSWSILQWNYKWSSEYGSKHWSVANPQQQGYDTVAIKSARLLKDGKTVFLEVTGIRPVMQMQITCNLDTADGAEIRQDIWNTIHVLGPAFAIE